MNNSEEIARGWLEDHKFLTKWGHSSKQTLDLEDTVTVCEALLQAIGSLESISYQWEHRDVDYVAQKALKKLRGVI